MGNENNIFIKYNEEKHDGYNVFVRGICSLTLNKIDASVLIDTGNKIQFECNFVDGMEAEMLYKQLMIMLMNKKEEPRVLDLNEYDCYVVVIWQ